MYALVLTDSDTICRFTGMLLNVPNQIKKRRQLGAHFGRTRNITHILFQRGRHFASKEPLAARGRSIFVYCHASHISSSANGVCSKGHLQDYRARRFQDPVVPAPTMD